VTEQNSPANQMPADLLEAHRLAIAENAALRTALRDTEARAEKQIAFLKQQIAHHATNSHVDDSADAELRLYEAEQRARQTAELLRTANIALTQSLDLQTVLETLLDYLADLLPYDSGSILLRRGASGLIVRAIRGYGADLQSYPLRGRLLPIAQFPHLEAVIGRKGSVQINDTRTYPAWQPHFFLAGEIRSWLGVPLLVSGQVIGLCALNHQEPDHFSDEYRLLAETLATQAAIAIQNARWVSELRASREQLRLLAERVVSAQEEERQRVSRELHDEAGQSLTALKMSLELLRADLPADLESANQSLSEAIELTDQTMEHIRLLAHGLRPPALDTLGLNAAVEGQCLEFTNRSGLEVRYEGCDLPRLADATAISLYRFVQEALTNVAKHAEASQVQVSLCCEGDQLRLTIVDDGRGFASAEEAGQSDASVGMGLIGMEERMALLQGALTIESEPGKGTRLIAAVPLHPAGEEVR
jgi:signal transduction histidine kinase